MNREQQTILQKTEAHIKKVFSEDTTGHDYYHILRVRNKALAIARTEPDADGFILELAALLHDLGDHKLFDRPPRTLIGEFLNDVNCRAEVIEHVITIAEEISYKGAGVSDQMSTLEGRIVQDADRLDAMGAIGIARTFAFGGSKNRPIHDPDVKPVKHDSFQSYQKDQSPTINHFYEKLLLLKDRMNTEEGKKTALSAHAFMEEFLRRFYKEWEGDY